MSSDDGFARPLMVALRSLMDHLGAGRKLVFHFLDFGLAPAHAAKVRAIVDDPRVTVDWRRQDGAPWMPAEAVQAGVPPAQCARMLAASIFSDLDRILYLDADIVVAADIGLLWETPLDAAVAACRDQFFPWMGLCTWLDPKVFGFEADAPHFNSGVLLADLARWRREGLEPRLMALYCAHHARFKTHDQDAFNLALCGRWQALPIAWNRGPWLDNAFHPEDIGATRGDFDEARRKPRIIHYPTPDKPWISGASTPLNDPFFAVAARLDLGEWGRPRRRLRSDEKAWGLMMGLAHRVHLRALGVLGTGRFLLGSTAGLARHPLLALRGMLLLGFRKAGRPC